MSERYVHLNISIPLEYEATGEFRPPLTGDLYLDDYGHVQTALVDWPNKCCIILRERKPQHGPWQDEYDWTGEVCYGKDIAGRVAAGHRSGWQPFDYSLPDRFPKLDGIYFILRLKAKAKPSLSVRVRSWMPRAKTRTSQTACVTVDELSGLADDIESREKVIAEVIAELREIGCSDGRLHDCADRLEGKE